jgi:hypothetical protein
MSAMVASDAPTTARMSFKTIASLTTITSPRARGRPIYPSERRPRRNRSRPR